MGIVLLSEGLISRIAAGEVVERPASVVKELVENSLDAGAREVAVTIEGSGSILIRVCDDGTGIPFGDMPLALESHATSKLKNEEDLFHISTLGFRGEALASIGSVSRLEIVSRTELDEMGCRLQVDGGRRREAVRVGCPVGTTVEVRDLFVNIPARRKFLKSPTTEFSHISDVINRMALAYPKVHFRLVHGDKTLSDYVVTPRYQDRLEQVLGGDVARGMRSFSWQRGEIRISGFLSLAPSSFPSSRYLRTFVNHRFVRDRILTHAVLGGYETLLMKGRYPAVALFMEVPYREVDVNVHPAKVEVRFRRQGEVHDAVVEAIRGGLKREAKEPGIKVSQDEGQPFMGVRERPLSYGNPVSSDSLSLFKADPAESSPQRHEVREGFFSSLDILGQILGCYIVCQSSDGMALIDQHAAHERIAFEKMRYQMAHGRVERQDLLIPQVLEFPLAESLLLEQWLGAVENLGFTVETFGRNTFAIKSVPALFPAGDWREVLRRIVAELAEVGESSVFSHEMEERLMTIACHNVIRANRRLSLEEIQALLGELDGVDFATQCPHGRPVFVEFSQLQLEKLFKRA